MKTISVRLEPEQAEKLTKLSDELKNSDAGVLRFALDLLWKTVNNRQVVSPVGELRPVDAAPVQAGGGL